MDRRGNNVQGYLRGLEMQSSEALSRRRVKKILADGFRAFFTKIIEDGDATPRERECFARWQRGLGMKLQHLLRQHDLRSILLKYFRGPVVCHIMGCSLTSK
jgi:hypothetical protein